MYPNLLVKCWGISFPFTPWGLSIYTSSPENQCDLVSAAPCIFSSTFLAAHCLLAFALRAGKDHLWKPFLEGTKQIFWQTAEVATTFWKESFKLFLWSLDNIVSSRCMFCVTVAKTMIPDAMKSLLKNCTHDLLFKEYLVNDLTIFK